MVHGYHVILPMYGFWLPNDPRGSWSETVRKWEILRYGTSTKTDARRSLNELTPEERLQREAARRALAYPAVCLTEQQIAAIGRGFAAKAARSNYMIWACSILPEHTHLVIARHSYDVEQIANLLKGSATIQLRTEGCHPLASFARPGKRPPRMWSEHQWSVFLDSEYAIDAAIGYVEENPPKEGRPRQTWDFVKSFEGIMQGGWTTYH